MKKKVAILIGCVLSFLFPALTFLYILKSNGILPYGSHTILFTDSQGQYIYFISYLKTIFTTKNDIYYTFAKPLGGEMSSLLCYYLFSPFNFIYLFVKTSSLPIAISYVTALKIGSMGLTMYILMNYMYKQKHISNLIFSISYALCSYVIIYNFNFMFLDGVIFLPLVILGIEKMFEGKKYILYSIFLAIAILVNYYIGFMICIFAVMFFVYKLYSNKRDKLERKALFMQFIEGSLIAGALSSLNWFVAIINMAGSKTSFGNRGLSDLRILWQVPEFLSNFTSNSFNGMNDIMEGPPLIFIGSTCLGLFIMYFFNKQIKTREKIAAGSVAIIFVLCMAISTLNDLFHGGATPNWFPFRFAFIFNFFLIYLAAKEFNNIKGLRLHHFIVPISITIILYTILKAYELETGILIDALILVVNFIFIALMKKINKKWFSVVAVTFIVGTNFYNMAKSGKQNIETNMKEAEEKGSTNYVSYEKFQNEYNEIKKVVDFVKDYDESGYFYRMEKTFYSQATYNLANNDSFMFDYAGVSHYSSCDKLSTRNYISSKLGFHSNNSWNSYGLGSTLSANSLMGIKYIIDRDYVKNSILITDRKFGAHDFLLPIETFQSYQNDNIYVSENPYALGIGYLSAPRGYTNGRQGEYILDDDGNYMYDENEEILVHWYNIFEYQNHMFKDLSGEDFGDIFSPLQYNASYSNIAVIDDNHFKLVNVSSPGYITYNINLSAAKIENSNNLYPVYYYITPGYSQHMKLSDNAYQYGDLYYFGMYNYAINPIQNISGLYKNYKLTLNGNLTWDKTAITSCFYYENIDILEKYFNALKQNEVQLKEISSSHLKGKVTYNSKKPLLTFSIPYDGRWKIKINGKNVKTRINQDIFLAADLQNYKFEDGQILSVEIKYVAREKLISVFIGLIAIGYVLCRNYNLFNNFKELIKKSRKKIIDSE